MLRKCHNKHPSIILFFFASQLLYYPKLLAFHFLKSTFFFFFGKLQIKETAITKDLNIHFNYAVNFVIICNLFELCSLFICCFFIQNIHQVLHKPLLTSALCFADVKDNSCFQMFANRFLWRHTYYLKGYATGNSKWFMKYPSASTVLFNLWLSSMQIIDQVTNFNEGMVNPVELSRETEVIIKKQSMLFVI